MNWFLFLSLALIVKSHFFSLWWWDLEVVFSHHKCKMRRYLSLLSPPPTHTNYSCEGNKTFVETFRRVKTKQNFAHKKTCTNWCSSWCSFGRDTWGDLILFRFVGDLDWYYPLRQNWKFWFFGVRFSESTPTIWLGGWWEVFWIAVKSVSLSAIGRNFLNTITFYRAGKHKNSNILYCSWILSKVEFCFFVFIISISVCNLKDTINFHPRPKKQHWPMDQEKINQYFDQDTFAMNFAKLIAYYFEFLVIQAKLRI